MPRETKAQKLARILSGLVDAGVAIPDINFEGDQPPNWVKFTRPDFTVRSSDLNVMCGMFTLGKPKSVADTATMLVGLKAIKDAKNAGSLDILNDGEWNDPFSKAISAPSVP